MEMLAKRSEPHGIPETFGTVCHNCRHLSCIATRKRTEPWRFFCENDHKRISPHEIRGCDGRDEWKWG